MDANEAKKIIQEFESDLAAEQDASTRAWYRQEMELQPHYQQAVRTLEAMNTVASQIGKLAEKKAAGDSSAEKPPLAEGDYAGILPEDEEEKPRPLLPEEILRQRIEKRYAYCLKGYEAKIAAITTTKKSKREHMELLARREFARDFNNFLTTTGDEHIVLRPKILHMVVREICTDPNLAAVLFDDVARYAQKNPLEVTAVPANFAHIIAQAVEGRSEAKNFEKIMRGIFASDPDNFGELNLNLANAAFELIEDDPALREVPSIVYLKKPYVPLTFVLKAVEYRDRLLAQGRIKDWLDYIQVPGVFGTINTDLTGQHYEQSPSTEQAVARQVVTDRENFGEGISQLTEEQMEMGKLINESFMVYDPVELYRLDGEKIDVPGLKPMPDILREYLRDCEMYKKRMKYLAPYSYGVRAARSIMGLTGRPHGTHGVTVPLSPAVSIDAYVPYFTKDEPFDEYHELMSARFYEIYGPLMQHAIEASDGGIHPFDDEHNLRMQYESLFENESEGVIIYRPGIPLDRRIFSPLQLLTINYLALRGNEDLLGHKVTEKSAEDFARENTSLRQTIHAEQSRFLGRRPVRFVMPRQIQTMSGLISLSLRYDPKFQEVAGKFELDDGIVDMEFSRELEVKDGEGALSLTPPAIREYYENMVLKLVKHWACGVEVHTSEGVISERRGNAANMGHFAYLRVREEDGYRYRPTEQQAEICVEEQRLDLAVESQRRRSLDPTGQERNSTYVRENYDPNIPPLDVYTPNEQIN